MFNPVFDQIKKDITENDIVLYMKGTATFPQCGFSAAVVQARLNWAFLLRTSTFWKTKQSGKELGFRQLANHSATLH